MTSVRLEHLSKAFAETRAVDDISLTIEAGELFFLLGPSGCGKSTLLRLIAGLQEPTAGRSSSATATSRPSAPTSATPSCAFSPTRSGRT